METWAGSIEGNSRTPKKLYPISPNKTIVKLTTIVNTGLFMLNVDKLMFNFLRNIN
jgi:hypothetical protein